MAKLVLNDIQSGYQTADQYNENNRLIEEALENTVSRDGTTPNTLLADIDANSNSINNIQTTRTQVLYINGQQATVGAIGEKGEQGDAGTDGVDGIDGTDGIDGVTGVVAQVVNMSDGEVATAAATIPADDTIPQNTEGAEFMSLSITPINTNNLLKIEVVAHFAIDAATQRVVTALFQDSTADALAVAIHTDQANGYLQHSSFTHWMVAGTTSPTTFKVRAAGNTGNTITFNGWGGTGFYGGVLASGITITEYMA